jgi:hypothetical protein
MLTTASSLNSPCRFSPRIVQSTKFKIYRCFYGSRVKISLLERQRRRATEFRRPVFGKPMPILVSYPHPLERRTPRLRLLPPGPGQIRLANSETASLQRRLRDRQPQGTDIHRRGKPSPTLFDASISAVSPSYRGFTVEAEPFRGPLAPHLRPAARLQCFFQTLKLSESILPCTCSTTRISEMKPYGYCLVKVSSEFTTLS